jgi:hypothetical protein
MTSQVNGYDFILLRKLRQLFCPVAPVAEPTVDKDKSRLFSQSCIHAGPAKIN